MQNFLHPGAVMFFDDNTGIKNVKLTNTKLKMMGGGEYDRSILIF